MLRTNYQAALVTASILLCSHVTTSAAPARIIYQAMPLGGARWAYTYDVMNLSLSQPVREFTIWFDRTTQHNLTIATPNSPAGSWDELVTQPDAFLQTNGFYDALSLAGGLATGDHATGFTVAFDWLGAGMPGSQPFDIIDPVSFEVLYSSQTIPEPASLAPVAACVLALAARRRRKAAGLPCASDKPPHLRAAQRV